MNTVKEVCQFIAQHIKDRPVCVETGSVYAFTAETIPHHTTNNIIQQLCIPRDGLLLSIDLDDHDAVLRSLFQDQSIPFERLQLIQGDSVEQLSLLPDVIDVLWLDSGENADLTLNEFLTVQDQLNDRHYVLVDDIHNTGSVKYLKIVPLLKELGYDWVEISTPTGLFVAAKGYLVPR